MLYLLDTTALIDLSKGFERTTRWLKQRSDAGDDLGVCPITVAEFYAGLPAHEYSTWDAFFSSLVFVPISYDAALQAGKWRASFKAQGIQLSTSDTLVAAVAAEAGATVVTSNLRHYPMQVGIVDPRS